MRRIHGQIGSPEQQEDVVGESGGYRNRSALAKAALLVLIGGLGILLVLQWAGSWGRADDHNCPCRRSLSRLGRGKLLDTR